MHKNENNSALENKRANSTISISTKKLNSAYSLICNEAEDYI
mgnify:CR=1 FL=1